jgi:enoyl-CoA hydratase/carnithine racemase
MGIASAVYPQEQLLPEAIATMQAIARMPPLAVRLCRESLRAGYESGLPSSEQADIYRFTLLGQTKESHARHEAWRESKQVAR